MADNRLQQRQELYFKLSTCIAQISNAELRRRFGGDASASSWGGNNVLDVDGEKVFVKRVPITELEYDDMFSTRNVFELPMFYNYPLNSAGLGVFRELLMHVKTTNWVLDGSMPYFPMMYHYRIVRREGKQEEVASEKLARYVEYWGGSESVGRYIRSRERATHEVLLFLEHFPYSNVEEWMRTQPSKVGVVLDEMRSAIAFLLEHGIIHFDPHFYNIVTDGEHAYLTDFGLALDREFDLSREEVEFFGKNTSFDYGYLLLSLMFPLSSMYRELTDGDKQRLFEELGGVGETAWDKVSNLILDNAERLIGSELLPLNADYAAVLVKYRSVIRLFTGFFQGMRANNRKDDEFPDDELWRLLRETGFLERGV